MYGVVTEGMDIVDQIADVATGSGGHCSGGCHNNRVCYY